MSELLHLAEEQLTMGDANANRRACWLARSAMEERLDALLTARTIDPGPLASTRSKLSCLEAAYADEPGLASRAQYLWSRLSEACHQHAYQLSPTYGEVTDLVAQVAQLSLWVRRGRKIDRDRRSSQDLDELSLPRLADRHPMRVVALTSSWRRSTSRLIGEQGLSVVMVADLDPEPSR